MILLVVSLGFYINCFAYTISPTTLTQYNAIDYPYITVIEHINNGKLVSTTIYSQDKLIMNNKTEQLWKQNSGNYIEVELYNGQISQWFQTANFYHGGTWQTFVYTNYDVVYDDGTIHKISNEHIPTFEFISPIGSKKYIDENPNIQIITDTNGSSYDVILYGKDKNGNWEMNMTYIWDLTESLSGFYVPGKIIPYVPGINRITIENTGLAPGEPGFGEILAEVQFEIVQTNANKIDIIGFDNEKTYQYAPTWYVLRTGTYNKQLHSIYVNGVKYNDCPINQQITYYDDHFYNVEQGKYNNPYKIGQNIVEIKDATGKIVFTKKFVLLEWTDPNETNTWGTDTPTIPSDFMKRKFPFCIPYDIYNSVVALKSTPKAPVWEIDLSNSVFKGGGKFTIDFSQFEAWAKIVRWGTLLIFTFILIINSRRFIGD